MLYRIFKAKIRTGNVAVFQVKRTDPQIVHHPRRFQLLPSLAAASTATEISERRGRHRRIAIRGGRRGIVFARSVPT